jgi:CRISPR system Cascade subunit CasC
MPSQFLQIHTFTSYAASLLNRDDAGFAKRIPFGGSVRTRISSQCLKRHWRTFDGEHSLSGLDVPGSIRSRQTFDRHIREALVQDGVDDEIARAVTAELMSEVLGESPKAKAAKAKSAKDGEEEEITALETKQITVLGHPEVEYLRSIAHGVAEDIKSSEVAISKPKELSKAVKGAMKQRLGKDQRANLRNLERGAGLSAALFGRMVTSDILSREDAAIHVAHAFTVHEQMAEDDYFSAIDDIVAEGGELGSGHINTSELTSGLFYGYVVVDVPLLVSNLEGCERASWRQADRTLAAQVVQRLVHLVATVTPGAKLGSTAPYAHAHLVCVESSSAQPRTLANAFLAAVEPKNDIVSKAYAAFGKHLEDLDEMYGFGGARKLAAIGPVDALRGSLSAVRISADTKPAIDALASWAAGRVVEAGV